MEVINSIIHVQLTDAEREALYDAYTSLNDLYNIIDENDCTYANNAMTNTGYDRSDIALAANVLQTFASTDELKITK